MHTYDLREGSSSNIRLDLHQKSKACVLVSTPIEGCQNQTHGIELSGVRAEGSMPER